MNPTTLLSGLGAAITADPTLGGASSADRESTPGGGDLFLALVTGLLQGDVGGVADPADPAAAEAEAGTTDAEVVPETATTVLPPVITTGAETLPATAVVAGPAPDTEATDTDADTDPVTDESTTEVPAAVAPMLPIALAIAPLVAPPAAPVASTDTEGEPTTAPSSVEATTTATVAPAPSTGGSAEAGTDGSADRPSSGETPSADAGPRPETETPAPPTAAPRAEARADVAPTQVTGVPTTVAVAPTAAPTMVVAPSASADLPRVADQVFPEVLRVASNAETGTSRVTVKLNPEALGEVRVILTHRGGELEVSLAGGADARRALTEGAPELRRLLESVGRADSRIVIRDLPNGALPAASSVVPAPAATPTRTDVSTDLAGGAWSGAGRPGGEPAPKRDHRSQHHPGSTTATDGIPGATTSSRPIQTAGRSHAGLDLSM